MSQSVFRKLLGGDLDRVDGALKRFSEDPSSATGTLDVVHHTGKMARLFIWLLGLPKEGQGQSTTVRIDCTPGHERWNRRIGVSKFRTLHSVVNGLLEERAGKFRFLYRVTVVDGGIQYRQEKVYFLGLPLPPLFSPIIQADARGDEKGWNLDLTVSCPRCGPICQYRGWMETQ